MPTERDAPQPMQKRGSRSRRVVFGCVLALMILAAVTGLIALGELRAGRVLEANPDFAKCRLILRGTAEGQNRYFSHPTQKVVGQPYLLYVPAPGLAEQDHNEHAYRGPIVPVQRVGDKLRIFFLGGSTTYGWGVQSAAETYPFQLGGMLEPYLPAGVNGVEIINAGLPYGSSAEHLTHYLFKFRYYHPDIVVLECGGNDALVEHERSYQPDFSHWRQEIAPIKPLPPRYRFIMRSSMASLFMINCIQPDFVHRQAFVSPEKQTPPLVSWFSQTSPRVYQSYGYPDAYSAFHNNIQSLTREATADGAKLVFVPFRFNPHSGANGDIFLHDMNRFRDTLVRLSQELGCAVAEFDPVKIPADEWSDA